MASSQAFLIARRLARPAAACALALGDNLIFADHLSACCCARHRPARNGATVFAYQVRDPERYGVVSFDTKAGRALEVVEKPANPHLRIGLITGLYFLRQRACCEIAPSGSSPAARGELEITDLNRLYLEEWARCTSTGCRRGCAWLDAGMPDSLMQAANLCADHPVPHRACWSAVRRRSRSVWASSDSHVAARARLASLAKTELGRVAARARRRRARLSRRSKPLIEGEAL